MRRNINKIASEAIETFLLDSNTGNCKRTEFGYESDMFAHSDDRKRVVAYIRSIGLDVFKRGTKEPVKIAEALKTADWQKIKELDPNAARATSMVDSF